MEEHQTDCFLCGHPVLKHILTGLLVFLGAFTAFYVVTDWHYKRMLDPVVQMRKMDKMMMKEQHQAERMFDRQAKKDFNLEKKTERFIRAEKDADNYKIIIDLKPFDNDEKNVEVTTNGNVLTVTAAGAVKKHGTEHVLKVSQSYSFNDDVDLNKLTKIREGNEYIIFIPID